jgi:two-component system NarL family sensor kinase
MPNSNSESIYLMISTTALILLLAGFIVTILYLYKQKQFAYQRNIEEINICHEKDMLQSQLEIQEQTLLDVSRDIHDNIALGLTLSKLHLNTLNYPKPVQFQDKIDISINLIGEAIHNLSNISKSLNSDIIRKYGLLKAIDNEISNLSKTSLFNIEQEIIGAPVFLEFKKELVIFRVIQESFNNILKHAEAKNISIVLNYGKGHLLLTVTDDGKGFSLGQSNQDKSGPGGSGLNNMQQRARTINGDCTIVSKIGGGTMVTVHIPLSETPKNNNHG